MSTHKDKLAMLRRRFRDMGSAVVAFSGGVDSAVLAKVGHEELGERMIAVTAISPSYPMSDNRASREFCRRHGIPHYHVETREFEDGSFIENPADRCYFCKKALYDSLMNVAESRSFNAVVEGTNASDLNGHRPGYRASQERGGVLTPLIECGITKDEVRSIARVLNLGSVADKPATACLSSRIPTGTRLDPVALARVDAAEDVLRAYEITQVRVRHHGDLARIEVNQEDIGTVIEHRREIESKLKNVGYRYITVDLSGYRPATP